jgi:hypothetical protein
VYFGELATLGPENVGGAEPYVSVRPVPPVTLSAGAYLFWRQSRDDGVYGVAGFPLVPPATGPAPNTARYVGTLPELLGSWQVGRYVTVTGVYDGFRRGAFLTATPGARDVHYVGVWVTARF